MRIYNQKDAETLRERDIKIKLTDEEVTSLLLEATRRNTTVEELLEDFVANLTGSIRNRGSDERELANEYVERCIYSFDDNESFLQWLSIYGDLTGVLIELDNLVEALADDDIDEIEYSQGEIREAYDEYRNAGGMESYDEAIERLKAYQKTKARLEA